MTQLVLLTSQYPFGIAKETFLEAELPIVAERFTEILVLPSATHPTMRAVPQNVEVVQMAWTREPTKRSRIAALASRQAANVVYSSRAAASDLARHASAPRVYVDVLGRNILKARELRELIQRRSLHNAVFYDYWFENSTIALALVRRSGAIRTAIARAHGFDVYDDQWGGHPVPFRQAKAVGLDAVYPTSVAAQSYLRRYVPALDTKTEVHKLGVVDPGTASPTPSPSGRRALIVTCAALHEVKRIHLVPQALARLKVPFEWVHIGEGPERSRVEAVAKRLLPSGTWRLAGQMPNRDVRAYYRQHPVRVLLSLSRSEGEPVSMMEAISYGIPIVACNVGGVSELVHDRIGILVDPEADPQQVADALREALADDRFDRDEIREEWRLRYNAAANYARFADALLRLHGRSVDHHLHGRPGVRANTRPISSR